MIGRLRGEIVERGSSVVILEVGGVGYKVEMGVRQLNGLPPEGEVVLSISTRVKEDDIRLFGFQASQERDAFEVLLGVSGIGPKAAIALLGSLSLADLAQAIESENISVISSAPGIGPKTARRCALELKGKLPLDFDASHTGAAPQIRKAADPLPLALAQLGYRKSEIDQALVGLVNQDLDGGTLAQRLSGALKILSGAV
jgi:Holliday junction DNA helicase RuvA